MNYFVYVSDKILVYPFNIILPFNTTDGEIIWKENGGKTETMTNETKIDFKERFIKSNDTTNKTCDGICVDEDSWQSSVQFETITFDPSVPKAEKNPVLAGSQCKKWTCGGNKCYCDSNCLLLRDCCLDAFASTFSMKNMSNMYQALHDPHAFLTRSNLTITEDIARLNDYGSCQLIQLSSNPKDHTSFLVIDRCPITFSGMAIIKEFCESINQSDFRNIYVSQRIGNHVIYRNIFCAFCHGLTINQLLIWNVTTNCQDDKIKQSSISEIQATCEISYNMPLLLDNPRRCFQSVIDVSKCTHEQQQNNDNMTKLLCSGYYEPVKFDNKSYRNKHCLSCSNIGNTSQHTCHHINVESLKPGPGIPGFNLLFAITDDGISMYGKSLQFPCSDNKVFDFISQDCRVIDCPIGFEYVNGECILSNHVIHLNDSLNRPLENNNHTISHYQLYMEIEANMSTTTILDFYELDKKVTSVLELFNQSCFDNSLAQDVIPELEHNIKIHNNTIILHALININSSADFMMLLSCLKEVSATMLDLKNIKLKNYVDKEMLECPNSTTMFNASSKQISFHHDTAVTFLDMNRSIDLHISRFDITFSQGNGHIELLFYCYSDLLQLNCSKIISYNSNEYSYLNRTLLILNITTYAKKFYIEHDKLYICARNDPESESEIPFAFQIITNVCLALSILALLILIICQCIMPTLLNLHGKNLVCFSFSLLLAQLLFLTCPLLPNLIQYVPSIFHHYFWLSTFVWMSVIAYDIGRKFFVRTMMTGSGSDKIRFRLYCVTGWGLPLVDIMICIVLEFTQGNSLIGYNGNGNCWLSNPVAVLYSFYIPVHLSFLVSLICFVVALYGIESSRRSAVTVTKNKGSKNMCLVYTKIAFVIGMTWLLVLLSSKIQYLPLFYCSTIMNALQGLFVCMISICNNRTIQVIKRKNTNTKYIKKSSMPSEFSTI